MAISTKQKPVMASDATTVSYGKAATAGVYIPETLKLSVR